MCGEVAMPIFAPLSVAGAPRLATEHRCLRCGIATADLLIIDVSEDGEIKRYGGCSLCLYAFKYLIYRPRADSISNLAAKFANRRMVEALIPCITDQLDTNNLTAKSIAGVIAGLLEDSNGE